MLAWFKDICRVDACVCDAHMRVVCVCVCVGVACFSLSQTLHLLFALVCGCQIVDALLRLPVFEHAAVRHDRAVDIVIQGAREGLFPGNSSS